MGLSQNIMWNYTQNGIADRDDEGAFMGNGLDGMIYTAGYLTQDSTKHEDGYVVRLKPNGDTLWTYIRNGAGDSTDMYYIMRQDAAMNLYALGVTVNAAGNRDVIITSLDTNGAVRWHYIYNGTANGTDESWFGLAVGPDGNIYSTLSIETIAGGKDAGILSLTAAGAFRWLYQFNGTGNGDDECISLTIGPDGNIYANGYTTQVGTGEDILILSIDPNGNQRFLYFRDGNLLGSDMSYIGSAFDGAGNVYVPGHLRNGTSDDFTIISLKPNGNQRWIYSYTGTGLGDDIAHHVIIGDDGNVYAGGVTRGLNNYDIAAVSLDTAGSQRWTYSYNGTSDMDDNCLVLDYGYDGNIYLSGSVNELNNSRDWGILCLSNTGVQKWVTEFNGAGNEHDESRPVWQSPDGTIYSCGFTTNNANDGRDLTVMAMCTQPVAAFTTTFDTICRYATLNFTNSSIDGVVYEWKINGVTFSNNQNAVYNFGTTGTFTIRLYVRAGSCVDSADMNIFVDICSGVEEQQTISHIIYPNPFSDMATLELKDLNTNSELVLFDELGREVRNIPIPAGTRLMIIEREDLASGMYFYNLFSEDKVVAKGKLIIK